MFEDGNVFFFAFLLVASLCFICFVAFYFRHIINVVVKICCRKSFIE